MDLSTEELFADIKKIYTSKSVPDEDIKLNKCEALPVLAENIVDYEDEDKYDSQFRGDYLDLRDFIKAETDEEKYELCNKLSKHRLVLIREHLLMLYTFSDEEDIIINSLENIKILNKIIYNDIN